MGKSKYEKYYNLTSEKGTCLKCGTVIKKSGGSSVGLKTHLKTKHDIDVDSEILNAETPKEKPKQNSIMSNFVIRESLEELISREASQLGATFRYLAKSILVRDGLKLRGYQDNAPRSHPTVQRLVHKSAEKHREILKRKLKKLVEEGQRFCLITDEWTCSTKRRRYQNVNLHIKGISR